MPGGNAGSEGVYASAEAGNFAPANEKTRKKPKRDMGKKEIKLPE
jgi:hypothetical protein